MNPFKPVKSVSALYVCAAASVCGSLDGLSSASIIPESIICLSLGLAKDIIGYSPDLPVIPSQLAARLNLDAW